MPFAAIGGAIGISAGAAAGLAGAALGIGSSLISSSGANSAAQTEANASDQASQVQLDMFNQIQQNEAPYLASGPNALSQLMAGVGVSGNQGPLNAAYSAPYNPQFQQDPGYQFQLQQGNSQINNASTVTGPGGNTLKALNQFGQGVANQDYNNYLNNYNTQYWNQYNAYTGRQNQQFGQLQTLSGIGQNAAASLGGYGTSTANNIGNNIIGAGNASAAGQVASSNAIGNSLSNAGQNYLLYNALNGGGQYSTSGINPVSWGSGIDLSTYGAGL